MEFSNCQWFSISDLNLNLAFSSQVLYLVFGYTRCPPRTKPGFANIPFSRPPTKWKLAIQIVVGLKDLNKIFTGLFGWLWSVWNRLPSHLFYEDFGRKGFYTNFLLSSICSEFFSRLFSHLFSHIELFYFPLGLSIYLRTKKKIVFRVWVYKLYHWHLW